MAGRRKKNRTHVKKSKVDEKTPKSFVMRSGKVTKQVAELVRDLRKIMEPNTASRLQEKSKNKLKDFVTMAGPLGVSHFMIFSKSTAGTNLKLCKVPQGPTVTFRIQNFTLMKDIIHAQAKPRSPGSEYQTSPLLVLNNFNQEGNEFKLMTTLLQNMFPALNIQSMHTAECRRVVLFNYEVETNMISVRHYYIYVKHVGISKSVNKIVTAKIPNLNNLSDISEFIMNDGNLSESEVDDNDENTVTMSQNYVGRGNARNQKRAIKLIEIGPRIEMKLLKVQSGLCEGEVLYHSYIAKTEEEIEKQKAEREKKLKEKERRKQEQELNVKKKEGEKQKQREGNLAHLTAQKDGSDNDEDSEYEVEGSTGYHSTDEEESEEPVIEATKMPLKKKVKFSHK